MTDDHDELPCGCMGKTSLDRVVHPARRRVRHRLAAAGVYLTGALDCGLLPRRESLDRSRARVVLDGDGSVRRSSASGTATPAWSLAAVLAAAGTGASVPAFADVLRAGYGELSAGGRLTVAKGHSVQVPNADRTVIASERLRPRGERRPGYVAGNVDVVHAFPGIEPETQATIASAHALNDCYAYGATQKRVLRPLVGVPATADEPTPDEIEAWYRDGLSADVALRRPTSIRHGGTGRLFGATVTAEFTHVPPIQTGRVEPDDVVLLSRPLGAVAALAAAREAGDAAACERFTSILAADHVDVGRIVSAFSPDTHTDFDPDRHLKLATDVSGPGVGGVADTVARRGCRLHVERLPFVDGDAVRRSRRRWLVPDATIGTNGPIAMVGRPPAVGRVEARLRAVGCRPVRLGRIEAGDGPGIASTADGLQLSEFLEDVSLLAPDRADQRTQKPVWSRSQTHPQ
jgi:hypothetical protein